LIHCFSACTRDTHRLIASWTIEKEVASYLRPTLAIAAPKMV